MAMDPNVMGWDDVLQDDVVVEVLGADGNPTPAIPAANVPAGCQAQTFGSYTLPGAEELGLSRRHYNFVGWKRNGGGAAVNAVKVINKGDSWSYWDRGSLDGTEWQTAGTSEWSEGATPLGYGKNTIATAISYGGNSSEKYPTYYFRKDFNIDTDPSDIASVTLNFTADDGFIVYVNGAEAYRYLLPEGLITYETYATTYAPDNWNYEEGERVRVVCYTNAPSAQLILNDKPVDATPQRDPQSDIIYWDLPFQPGHLRCQASNGATYDLWTNGRPHTLKITTDKDTLRRDADEVVHVFVEVTDQEGHLVKQADNEVTVSVEGGTLLGIENGNIQNNHAPRRAPGMLPQNRLRTFNGQLVAYVKTNNRNRQNSMTIKVSAPLIGSQTKVIALK